MNMFWIYPAPTMLPRHHQDDMTYLLRDTKLNFHLPRLHPWVAG